MGRLLVIGGSGLLGQYVCREGLSQGWTVFSTYWSTPAAVQGARALPADLTSASSLQEAFRRARPDAVVLCSALTAVDDCEERPEEARRVNAEGPGAVAGLCAHQRAHLVHVSTDYVFDGEAGPYDEAAEPNPLNVYGRTKREGERAVLRRGPGAAVVRLCAVFGWNRLREKPNSVTWILGRLRKGETVSLFRDQSVSPTYAADAAAVLLDLGSRNEEGIFHVAPRDCLSRVDLGQRVCETWGLPTDRLRPVALGDAGLRAPRPRHSCLLPKRTEEVLSRPIRPLRDALLHMRDSE